MANKKALVVKNIGIEGQGAFGKFLVERGYSLREVDLAAGDRLPPVDDGFSAVLFMGGPMNVYEEDKYPFLKDELEFLRQCIGKKIKTIGFCLGAQMTARALGAQVKKNRVKEIGWLDIALTDEGKKEPLFTGLPERFKVFHWHGDTFDLPQGARHLAYSDDCQNQAFIHGTALALQFHPEVEGESDVRPWAEMYLNELRAERGARGFEILMAESTREYPLMRPHSLKLFENIAAWLDS